MAPRPYQPHWRHHDAHQAHFTPAYPYSYPPFVTPFSIAAPNPTYTHPYYYGEGSATPCNIAIHYPYIMPTDQRGNSAVDGDGMRPAKKSKPSSAPLDEAERTVKPKVATPPGKGLRHFSMKICEKVKGKGTSSYNEVADELIRELREEEARAYQESIDSLSAGKKKRAKPPQSKYDEKNIRRRVYDALNVLMAMDIIVKDKKMIVWNGLPGNRTLKSGDDSTASKKSDGGESSLKKSAEQLHKLNEERSKLQAEIQRKREILQELMTQNVCFSNLYQRNHAREAAEMASQKNCEESPSAQDSQDEKIPLPFIVVNTNHKAVIQCEMCPERTNVNFDFTMPFEINDDNEILKRIGMDQTSREELQRSLPPDLFDYCSTTGLIENIVKPARYSYAHA